jgi:putative Holliday junction resolvase
MSDTTDVVVAFDWGSSRIGVASTDLGARLPTPREAILEKDKGAQLRLAAGVVARLGASTVLVGLPLELDGSDGVVTRSARMFAAKLAATLAATAPSPPRVVLVDERFSSAEATARLREAGARPTGRDGRSGRLDSAAAAVLLGHWLDGAGAAADGRSGR